MIANPRLAKTRNERIATASSRDPLLSPKFYVCLANDCQGSPFAIARSSGNIVVGLLLKFWPPVRTQHQLNLLMFIMYLAVPEPLFIGAMAP